MSVSELTALVRDPSMTILLTLPFSTPLTPLHLHLPTPCHLLTTLQHLVSGIKVNRSLGLVVHPYTQRRGNTNARQRRPWDTLSCEREPSFYIPLATQHHIYSNINFAWRWPGAHVGSHLVNRWSEQWNKLARYIRQAWKPDYAFHIHQLEDQSFVLGLHRSLPMVERSDQENHKHAG